MQFIKKRDCIVLSKLQHEEEASQIKDFYKLNQNQKKLAAQILKIYQNPKSKL